MISSNSEGNDEQFSGNELDESGGEESEATPEEEQASGHELDEPEDEESKSVPEEGESSGGELDEPEDEESKSVPEEGQISGNELDESGGEESESIPEEKKFTGLELDELDVPPIPEEEDSKGIERKFGEKKKLSLCVAIGLCRDKQRLLLCIAIGLCLLIGIGYLYLKWKKSNIPFNQKEETPQFNKLTIPKDQLLIFNSFIIPFKENKQFTYISLSISFYLPNKELRREMIEKKGQLRGIIYDILREEINKAKEIPPLKELKKFVIRGLNTALSTGKASEVYITKFLLV